MPAHIDEHAVRAVFALPQTDGSFEGVTARYLAEAGARRPLLLLSFAPKTAGTFFREAAVRALDGQMVRLVHAQGGRDGTLYLPSVLLNLLDDEARPAVTHVHMQALTANVNFMDALGLKPIIMLRDLADTLASFLDMLEKDPAARAEGLNCQVPADFPSFSRSRKLDFMMDVIAPWYASYFATWKAYADEAEEAVCVLDYRDFRRAPAEALWTALLHAGFEIKLDACEAALQSVWRDRSHYRFNKGVAGNGRAVFTPAHLASLSRLLGYYPQLADWMGALMAAEEAPQSSARPPSTIISAPST
jgi:hypothetical protein